MVDLIKKLFDPSLNLFRRTSNAHVYPSPMSNVSETNHLDLIEFAGKMLAKAIYEVRSRRTHLRCIWFFLPSLLLVRAPFRGGGEFGNAWIVAFCFLLIHQKIWENAIFSLLEDYFLSLIWIRHWSDHLLRILSLSTMFLVAGHRFGCSACVLLPEPDSRPDSVYIL